MPTPLLPPVVEQESALLETLVRLLGGYPVVRVERSRSPVPLVHQGYFPNAFLHDWVKLNSPRLGHEITVDPEARAVHATHPQKPGRMFTIVRVGGVDDAAWRGLPEGVFDRVLPPAAERQRGMVAALQRFVPLETLVTLHRAREATALGQLRAASLHRSADGHSIELTLDGQDAPGSVRFPSLPLYDAPGLAFACALGVLRLEPQVSVDVIADNGEVVSLPAAHKQLLDAVELLQF